MNKVKLSVIVPCYNVEKYVEDCVNSIVKNEIPNMEIILVNDGSKDGTLKLLKKLEKKHSNLIKLIDQENQGLSMARNNGIKASRGEYIAFVDSDDSICDGMYKAMIDKADEGDFDVVACGVNVIYPDKTIQVDSGLQCDLLNREDVKKIMNSWYTVVWNKIYKRKFFDKVQFKRGVWFEDVEFLYRLIPYINTVGKVDGYYCNYMQREGSITYTYNEKLYHFIENFNGIIEFYKKNNFYDEYKDLLEAAYVRYSFATFVKRLAKAKDKEVFNKGVDFAIEEVNNHFPDYKTNVYLKQGMKGFYLRHFNKFVSKIVYVIEKNRMN